MKLGEVIASIEFSDSEKDRLGESLTAHAGLPYQVLESKARVINDVHFWRSAQRRFNVRGFRDGAPAARQIVVREALASLKVRPGAKNTDVWPLYRECARSYVVDETPNLNRLLAHEDFEEGSGSLTEQIVRNVISKMPLYDVGQEEVEHLYDIWGFERLDNFTTILNGRNLDVGVLKRFISLEREQTRREVSTSISLMRADIVEEREATAHRLSELTRQVETAIERLSSFQELSGPAVETLVQRAVAQRFDESRRESQKASNGGHAKDDSALRQSESKKFQEQLDDLKKQIAKLRASNSRVPPNGERAEPRSDGKALQSVEQVCRAWRGSLESEGIRFSTRASLCALLQLVRSSRVIVTFRPSVLTSLYNAFHESDVRQIAASPLWTSRADWSDAVSFVSTSSARSRCLVVHDFDVAVQEAYLVPCLLEWQETLPRTSPNRIVLVASRGNFDQVSERVLEITTRVSTDEAGMFALLGESGEADEWAKRHFTRPASFALEFEQQTNVRFEEEIRHIAANCGAQLPPRLLARFVSVYMGLSAVVRRMEGGPLAQAATLAPWVTRARGESVARMLSEALQLSFKAS